MTELQGDVWSRNIKRPCQEEVEVVGWINQTQDCHAGEYDLTLPSSVLFIQEC